MTDPITPSALADAIRAQTSEWLADETVPDVRSIGSGMCYEFAEAVMARLGVGDEHGMGWSPSDSHGRLIDCVTEDWWSRILLEDGSDSGEAEHFHADLPRLIREGAPLPDGVGPDDQEFAWFLGARTHDWLVLDGRHHDATCPDGADHWLLMPWFADQIAGFMADRAAAA